MELPCKGSNHGLTNQKPGVTKVVRALELVVSGVLKPSNIIDDCCCSRLYSITS